MQCGAQKKYQDPNWNILVFS